MTLPAGSSLSGNGVLATILWGGLLASACLLDTGCARQVEGPASPATERETGCQDLGTCAAACNAGDAEGCFYAGYRYEVGVEVPRRVQRAEELYAAGCAAGSTAACVGEGRVAEASGDPDAIARAMIRFDQACEAGAGEACLRVALLAGLVDDARWGRGLEILRRKCSESLDDGACVILANFAFAGVLGEANLDVAAAAYERTCETGDPVSCARAAELLARSSDGDSDTELARQDYLSRACELGLLRACTEQFARGLEIGIQTSPTRDSSRSGLASLCDRGQPDACAILGSSAFGTSPRTAASLSAAVGWFKRGCDAGSSTSCAALGRMIVDRLGTPYDARAAHAAFSRGCELGDEGACGSQGWMEASQMLPGAEPAAGRAMLASACERGDGKSCFRLAQRLRGDGDENPGGVNSIYERACQLGDGDGCAGLASALLDGRGRALDVGRAFELAVHACGQESGSGCVLAGQMTQLGEGREADPRLGLSFFREGCRLGNVQGCELVAQGLDAASAGAFWSAGAFLRDDACERGDASACTVLGVYAQRGLAGEVDLARAASLYRRACQSGESDACLYLGQMLVMESVSESASGEGLSALSRGCELGSVDACAWAGLPYHLGRGVPQDPGRAGRVYAETCEQGSAFGCIGLGKLNEEGLGRRRNMRRAREAYARACSLGASSYCR